MKTEKFAIERIETENEHIFSLKGELDLSVASEFRSALEPFVNIRNKSIILDLKDLTFIDSTGIGIIISVLKIRDQLNASFKIYAIPESIHRLFDLTGITKFIDITNKKQ